MRKEYEGGIWIEEGTPALLGVTKDFIEDSGDITFINFKKKAGDSFEKGEVLASFETAKAVADLEAPVSGKVVEVNEDLADDPDPLNENPENTWIFKIELA